MANWTSQPATFNPYVQQLPVEAMVSVGMEKQRRYEEGIRRIQSSIDQVAGLDIMKDEDRDYLRSQLDNLKTSMITVASGDFSDYQLTNSVISNVSRVAKDKNIQAAVRSTSNIRRQMQIMEEEKENGNYSPANEYLFYRGLSNYLDDRKIGSTFNQSYIPYFDVFEFAKETFNEIKPDGKTFDQIYQLGADGKPMTDENDNLRYSYAMTRTEQTGILPEKVKQTMDYIFSDPRVQQQLSIDGQYRYKDMTSEDLKDRLISQKKTMMSNYNDYILRLNTRAKAGEDVQDQIDALKSEKLRVLDSYRLYSDLAMSDPDRLKGLLYSEELSNKFTTMFGSMATSQKIMSNPAWRARFDQQKEARRQLEWQMEHGSATLEAPEGPSDSYTMQASQPTDKKLLLDQYYSWVNTNRINYEYASTDLIWEATFSGIQENEDKLSQLVANDMNREAAKRQIIRESTPDNIDVDAHRSNLIEQALSLREEDVTPIVDDKIKRYLQANRLNKGSQSIQNYIDKHTGGGIEKIKDDKDLRKEISSHSIDIDDNKYKLTEQDVVDLGIYASIRPLRITGHSPRLMWVSETQEKFLRREAEDAYERLRSRGLEPIAEALIEHAAYKMKKTKTAGSQFLPQNRSFTHDFTIKDEKYTQMEDLTKDVDVVIDKLREKSNKVKSEDVVEAIRNKMWIRPNVSMPILTGDIQENRDKMSIISNIASEYKAMDIKNEGENFDSFANGLDKIDINNPHEGYTVRSKIILNEENIPVVELVLSDEDKKQVGTMLLLDDQANNLGINKYDLYESEEASILRQVMNNNEGDIQTCRGNPAYLSTYEKDDFWYSKSDFPNLYNFDNYDARVNIRYDAGKYYPYVYIRNIDKSYVTTLQPSPNLDILISTLVETISPTFIDQLIAGEEAKKQRRLKKQQEDAKRQ